mgnify:FL=1
MIPEACSQQELQSIGKDNAEIFAELNSKNIFVSGATGLIGSTLIKAIVTNAPSAKIIAFVRDA